MFTWIISLAVTALVVFIILRPSKAEREHDEEVAKRLEDETIYDPETGAKLTLEQAESGHFIGNDGDDRVKSDEEIAEHYRDEEREVEYIRRYFAERKIPQYEGEDIGGLIHGSEMIKQFDDCNIASLWEIVPGVFIAIIQVLYSYTSGRSEVSGLDNQVVVVFRKLDRYHLYEHLKHTDIEITRDWVIARFDRLARYEDFKSVSELLPSSHPRS